MNIRVVATKILPLDGIVYSLVSKGFKLSVMPDAVSVQTHDSLSMVDIIQKKTVNARLKDII